ncbi:hypothetical protein FHP29_12650 [Nocardioides albidus]|uniref:NAD glycohydrolase translocation F5/8 type C domain-containing protein n=1 Tax=Nocardioides albidus TaxID=1517589 RepID=A0A5C4VWY0_9ACTN|nr:hypothetical protein [Nocardioides albidus]TNM39709.1 hypothetical protein FHP29_12650 [Nocardioides albidus]
MNRVCPDCGAALDADEQFCGNCGCYLQWSAASEPEPAPEPAPVAVEAAVEAAPPPTPPRRGRPQPASPPRLDRRGTAERPPAPVPPPPPVTGGGDGSGAGPAAPSVAEALVVPVDQQPAAPQPGLQQPGAQQPGRPRPQPRSRASQPPPEPLNPGDLVCGDCGAGNKATRMFCRRCGHTLAEAEVVRIPWWRRILRRRKRTTAAGSRPTVHALRRAPSPARLIGTVVALGALGIGGFLLRDVVIGAVDTVRDRVSGVEPQVPGKISASSSQPGHGARLARDGTPNKYWAPASTGAGAGEYLEVHFDSPVRLVYLLVTPGVSSSDEEAFLAQGRPKELRIVVDREGDSTALHVAHLEDKRGPARIDLGDSKVTRVRIEIRKAYAGSAAESRTAIGELEFFTRK